MIRCFVWSRQRALVVVLAVTLGIGLAGCSGSTSSPPAPAASSLAAASASAVVSPSPAAVAGSPAPIGSQPSAGPDALASVRANWTAFFDPTTPVARRISLLQDGAKFRHYLEVQAQPGVAHLTTEHVTAVALTGTEATVTYNILINGISGSALSNQIGEATLSRGTWQVSDTDFCNLLTLENKGKTLPGC